jgi:dephospho-CoA kinase
MYKIGITGAIASGKSTAAQALRELGARVWDADQVQREIVKPRMSGYRALKEAFGEAFFDMAGELDRKKLANLIFGDSRAREKLNNALHPIIIRDMDETFGRWEQEGVKIAFAEVPLLFEAGVEDRFDEIWCTSCGIDVQIQRLMQRNGLTRGEALARIDAQMDDRERRSRSNRVIDTCGSAAELKEFMKVLYGELLDELK